MGALGTAGVRGWSVHAAGVRRKFQEAMTFQLNINGKQELLDEKPKVEKLRCRGWGHTGGCSWVW